MATEQILSRAYNNLLPTYQQQISRRDFTSMQQLIHEIDGYERIEAELRRSKPARITALETPAAPQPNARPTSEPLEVKTSPAPGGRLHRSGNRCFRCAEG